MTFRLNAAWVGIKVFSGVPQINSVGSCSFRSGESGSVVASVKNVGSDAGSFEFDVSCGSIIQANNDLKVPFSVGQSKSVSIGLLTGGVNADFTDSCTLTVSDVASGVSKSQPFSCGVLKPAVCAIGDFQQVGDCVQTCGSDASWGEPVCCDEGKRLTFDNVGKVWICVDSGSSGSDNSTSGTPPGAKVCKPTFSINVPLLNKEITIIPNLSGECTRLGWLWSLFIGLIVFGGGFALFKVKLSKGQWSRGKIGIILLLSFLGLLAGLLWYFYWWTIALVVILALVLFFVTRRFL